MRDELKNAMRQRGIPEWRINLFDLTSSIQKQHEDCAARYREEYEKALNSADFDAQFLKSLRVDPNA